MRHVQQAVFGDGEFDASRLRSRNMRLTLGECKRILAPEGAMAALLEQYLTPLPLGMP